MRKAREENKSSYTHKCFIRYNNEDDDNVYYMPGILLGALHMLSSILITTLCTGYYYHFTHEENGSFPCQICQE